MLARAAFPSEGSNRKVDLLAAFISLKVVGLRTPIPHRLLSGGPFQFLAMWASQLDSYSVAAGVLRAKGG